jgi:flagellar basal body-associated protein FliL
LAQYYKRKKRTKIWLTLIIVAAVAFALGYLYATGYSGI